MTPINTPTDTKITRGILIDPLARSVTEIHIQGSTLEGMYQALGCSMVQRISLGFIDNQEQDLWLDEEGMLCDWDSQQFFELRGYPHPLAGRAIVFASSSSGDTVSAHASITAENFAKFISWVDPQAVDVPAPFMQTFAPDGTVEITQFSGSERWTYANQP